MKADVFQERLKGRIGLALGLITLALYLPVLNHGFVEYDDQQYVTENPQVQAGLTINGLFWAFGFHAANWHPLTWLSHMLDCQIYGARAWGHHLTSILLHAATTVLLFLVLNRMTGAIWRSAVVAALFAWHPLHVESVAWVAERKDVLCAFFWMLTLSAYVRYAEPSKVQSPKSKVFYALSLLGFALTLMAKPMGVTLPFVLLLLDGWPLQRVAGNRLPADRTTKKISFPAVSWGRLIGEKIPFFALSTVTCYLTVLAQEDAIAPTAGLPIMLRLGHVVLAYGHYLGAMLVPWNLAVYYPYDMALPEDWLAADGSVIILITVLTVVWRRQQPYLLVGWLWYLGTLVPVIGLMQVGDQAWADRYTYLPLIGIFMAGAWGTAELIKSRTVLRIGLALLAAGLLTLTSIQLCYWKNTETLFTHAFQATRDNYMAITILGSQLAQAGKIDEAMADYRNALQLKPSFPEAHFYLANALEQQGRLDEAAAEYKTALRFKPRQEQTHIFLAMVLVRQLQYDEAIAHYLTALQINPDSAVAQNNLARIYHTQGRFNEAAQHYQAALKIDAKLALAHNNYGILLLQKGELTEGALQLREAWQLNPTNAETRFNLALADNQLSRWAEAADLFANTVGPGSTDPKAQTQFAIALAHLSKTREAMSHYASALLLQPDYPDALDGLAWILATHPRSDFRNGSQAVVMAERACELTGHKDGVKLKTLAAAYAETGRYDQAIDTLQILISLAAKSSPEEPEARLMLKQFQLFQPWRTEPTAP